MKIAVMCYIFPDKVSVIRTLKPRLSGLIEPDFGLLDHLLSMEVLTHRQFDGVRSGRTVYERNDALLELLVSDELCNKFLDALRETAQTHIVNFIERKGSKL